MHQQMKHVNQELSREERQERREEEQQKQHKQKWQIKIVKKVLFYSVIFVGTILVIWGIFSLAGKRSFSGGQIHWHADLQVSVCGEQVPLPQPTAALATVHGEPFVGTPFMHLHSGPQIHIEGVVSTPDEIVIGKFMEVIGMHFTDTELLQKKNGDACPDGQPGRVKVLVNGQETNELTKHLIRDGQRIEIRFESS